jgi:type IV secretion system protein VirB1
MLSPLAIVALAAQCAPAVAPGTLLAVARAESGLDPLAIGVNGPRLARARPDDAADAARIAHSLIAAGRDIDLGLGQINVRNLKRLGLTVEAAFDPCRNLAATAQVLSEGYRRGIAIHGPGQAALHVGLSLYNTGNTKRGFANGYVARVLAQAGGPDPIPRTAAHVAPAPPQPLSADAPETWDVFGRAAVRQGRFPLTPPGATP